MSGQSSNLVADRLQNIGQQALIFGLYHDADDRLRARGTHQQPPRTVEPSLLTGDQKRYFRRLKIEPLLDLDVAQLLRNRREYSHDVAGRPIALTDHGHCLKGGEQAVAGGGEVGENDVARLL